MSSLPRAFEFHRADERINEDEIRLCPICGMAWIGGICKHTYKDVFNYTKVLQSRLDIAVEALRKLAESHDGMCFQYNLDAQEALARLEEK